MRTGGWGGSGEGVRTQAGAGAPESPAASSGNANSPFSFSRHRLISGTQGDGASLSCSPPFPPSTWKTASKKPNNETPQVHKPRSRGNAADSSRSSRGHESHRIICTCQGVCTPSSLNSWARGSSSHGSSVRTFCLFTCSKRKVCWLLLWPGAKAPCCPYLFLTIQEERITSWLIPKSPNIGH